MNYDFTEKDSTSLSIGWCKSVGQTNHPGDGRGSQIHPHAKIKQKAPKKKVRKQKGPKERTLIFMFLYISLYFRAF